ncbi:MAG: pseudouridine synthase [Herbinix sp.]|nr:pseudouridine synthase [Herbinix sp.]
MRLDKVILNPAEEIMEASDVIQCFGKEIVHAGKFYYMFHKPAGCVTAKKDAVCKTVLDYFAPDIPSSIFPVGRLDKDTEGLLLLTNDGDFSHSLMYPDKHVDKTYFFWAFGSLDAEDKNCLRAGIALGDEEGLAKAAYIEVEEEGNYEELSGKMNLVKVNEISNNPNQQVVSGYITITEGRKHQVKRMLKAVGCYVVYLRRVSIGGLKLDEALNQGQYRELTEEEIRVLL